MNTLISRGEYINIVRHLPSLPSITYPFYYIIWNEEAKHNEVAPSTDSSHFVLVISRKHRTRRIIQNLTKVCTIIAPSAALIIPYGHWVLLRQVTVDIAIPTKCCFVHHDCTCHTWLHLLFCYSKYRYSVRFIQTEKDYTSVCDRINKMINASMTCLQCLCQCLVSKVNGPTNINIDLMTPPYPNKLTVHHDGSHSFPMSCRPFSFPLRHHPSRLLGLPCIKQRRKKENRKQKKDRIRPFKWYFTEETLIWIVIGKWQIRRISVALSGPQWRSELIVLGGGGGGGLCVKPITW